jgi:hypothetical protein
LDFESIEPAIDLPSLDEGGGDRVAIRKLEILSVAKITFSFIALVLVNLPRPGLLFFYELHSSLIFKEV